MSKKHLHPLTKHKCVLKYDLFEKKSAFDKNRVCYCFEFRFHGSYDLEIIIFFVQQCSKIIVFCFKAIKWKIYSFDVDNHRLKLIKRFWIVFFIISLFRSCKSYDIFRIERVSKLSFIIYYLDLRELGHTEIVYLCALFTMM